MCALEMQKRTLLLNLSHKHDDSPTQDVKKKKQKNNVSDFSVGRSYSRKQHNLLIYSSLEYFACNTLTSSKCYAVC